ncbi:hypothetical protein UPYG_G00092420 [Umbra pygmaea]|uniref:Protein FAM217B n=1 Tax=Umbra pygmaea TaxID=75934 RepID=A0ABD0XG49_UMBPY
MGTVVHQRVAPGLNQLPTRLEKDWTKSSWANGLTSRTENRMIHYASHPLVTAQCLDNTYCHTSSALKKQQRRQNQKPNAPAVKHNNTSQLSSQGQSEPPPICLLSDLDGKKRRERSRKREEQQSKGRREEQQSRGRREEQQSRGRREEQQSRGRREEQQSRGRREDQQSRGRREEQQSRGRREEQQSRGRREEQQEAPGGQGRRVQQESEASSNCYREHKQPGSRRSRGASSVPPSRSSRCCFQDLTHQQHGQLGGQIGGQGEAGMTEEGEEDVDTDISDSERLPSSSFSYSLPQLNLRPEVIEARDFQPDLPGPRGHAPSRLSYPDFLPPPFNSWSLQQLAMYLHPEERPTHRSRAAGLQLDRYLDRLLQLEWHQIRTVQEESGRGSAVPISRCSSHHNVPTHRGRLSSPKSILQCQRAFPLTLLSSLSHPPSLLSHPLSLLSHPPSALLSGCTEACRLHTSHISHTHHIFLPISHPGLSFPTERPGRISIPRRSHSESGLRSTEMSTDRQRCCSPIRGIGHLKRMQAYGNIRNPVSPVRRRRASSAVRDLERERGRNGSGHSGAHFGSSCAVSRRRIGSEKRRVFSEGAGTGSCTRAATAPLNVSGTEAWARAMERAGFGTRTGMIRGLHWTGTEPPAGEGQRDGQQTVKSLVLSLGV